MGSRVQLYARSSRPLKLEVSWAEGLQWGLRHGFDYAEERDLYQKLKFVPRHLNLSELEAPHPTFTLNPKL